MKKATFKDAQTIRKTRAQRRSGVAQDATENARTKAVPGYRVRPLPVGVVVCGPCIDADFTIHNGKHCVEVLMRIEYDQALEQSVIERVANADELHGGGGK